MIGPHEQNLGDIKGMWMPKQRYDELLAEAHAATVLRRERLELLDRINALEDALVEQGRDE